MLKNKSLRSNQQIEQPLKNLSLKKRLVMLTATLIILMMTGGALAQWTGIFPVIQKSQPKDKELSPASFNANAQVKEYVYVNGKVVATEEPAGCFTLSSTSQGFADGKPNNTINTGSFNITATCNWTATSNAAFIAITGGASGAGNGIVTFTVADNTSTTIRSGTITVTSGTTSQIFTIYQGIAYADVPRSHPFYTEIGKLSARGMALSCSTPGNFCPTQNVTREEMAFFIIRGLYAQVPGYMPPTPGSQRFTDVPPSNPYYAYIEEMAVRQITLGCSTSTYCPSASVLRDQMAGFFIRALHYPGYLPPAPGSQRFNDVPPSNVFYAHIEEMAVRQITLGCGAGIYCPSNAIPREQMAAFLVRAFNL